MAKPRIKLSANYMNNAGEYSAAVSTGPRAVQFTAPSTGPNNSLLRSLPVLINRSRQSYRNNAWIRKGINSGVSNEIGRGIRIRSSCSDEGFRQAANALFKRWVAESCENGTLNFFGQQAMMCLNRRMAGEVFVRRVYRRANSGLAVPMQIQLLESEMLPISLNLTLKNGNKIKAGIEFNAKNQRVAYHFYTMHPYESGADLRTTRVPAWDVIHHFSPTRPGQIRGEPDVATALLRAHTFDSYDDAELQRKQTRAPFTGAIYREQYDDADYRYDPISGELISGLDPVPDVTMHAGSMLSLLPGEKVHLFDGDKTGDGYKDFMRQQLMNIAAAQNSVYELISGDWSNVNDRLVRAVLGEYRRSIMMAQDHLMGHQICRQVWHWFIDTCVYSGRLSAAGFSSDPGQYYSADHKPHGWPHLHPEQDINAKAAAIEANLESIESVVSGQGGDLEEIIEQNATAKRLISEAERRNNINPKDPA